jgi:prolyl-tRNA editing enzyme YbaK/EbsC (Cys-tRNA(Pro) deacylase)
MSSATSFPRYCSFLLLLVGLLDRFDSFKFFHQPTRRSSDKSTFMRPEEDIPAIWSECPSVEVLLHATWAARDAPGYTSGLADYPQYKTLIIESFTELNAREYFSVVLRASDRLCNKKLREYVESNRGIRIKKAGIVLASRITAELMTGYKSGSIAPVGYISPMLTLLDVSALCEEKIVVGSGTEGARFCIHSTLV